MAATLTLDLLTWDVTPTEGPHPATARHRTPTINDPVRSAWDSGADLVLLPEFTWMMLEPTLPPSPTPLQGVAERFWNEEWPFLCQALARPDKAVVLGTCPFFDPLTQQLRNRAPILRGIDHLHQDKLHLTPWEQAFSPGDSIQLFTFRGFTLAVIICLDIEVPELSALLRGHHIDLILCPSATETELGTERVDRCASARAVELGCHVGVSHLLGRSPSDLIDQNVGRVAIYHPSQVPFSKSPRWNEAPLQTQGIHRLRTPLDHTALSRMRKRTAETNPALLNPSSITPYKIIRID
jgi:predicted amidohydrolase